MSRWIFRSPCLMAMGCNGIEDYEYLTMAQELLGENFVSKTIAKVSKDLTHYTLSDAAFAKVRLELGSAIEAAAK